MEVDCEQCAGCCLDWRPLADIPDHERRGPQEPLDDTYNLVPLTRGEVRAFIDAGLGGALTPRLWRARDGPSVTVDGYEVAAVAGKPAFFVGLRKTPKPVAPFGGVPRWLPACVFLDPDTLQCRIHDDDLYPGECAAYPGRNLALDAETECERVEAHAGGDRLLDDAPPDDDPGLLFGPQAVGEKVFAHPDPDGLPDGVLDRLAAGDLTREDRAAFVAVAAASAPGTTAVEPRTRDHAYEAVLDADSWVERAIEDWARRADEEPPDSGLGERVEDARGAPGTPGWE